jgi:hypothetical protein
MPRKPKKTRLTDDIIERLCIAIRMGNYLDTACTFAGISTKQFDEWYKLGEAGEKKYVKLYEEVNKAEREAEYRILEMWYSHLKNDWRACRAFLERRFPEKWAEKKSTTLEGGNKPIMIKLIGNATGTD